MRVAVVTPFRSWGGVDRLVDGLVERQAQAGLDVVRLVPAPAPTGPSVVGAPVSPLPRPRHPGEVLSYVAGYPGRQRRLARALADLGPDVLVAFGLNVVDVLPACQGTGTPFVLSLNSDRRTLGTAVVRFAAARAGAVLAEGPGVTRRLLGPGAATPFHFLPPVAVPPQAPPPRPGPGLVLGMLCGFSPQKDHLLALAAVAEARARGADVTLRVAGDLTGPNPYRDGVLRRVAELGLQADVDLTGWTTAEDFLPTVDALLVTSRFEGVATSTLEGMAHERPYLSTAVGSLPELAAVSGAGRSLDRHLPRAEATARLGALIAEVAGDRAWLAPAGAAGRCYVARRCTWEAWLGQFRSACEAAA